MRILNRQARFNFPAAAYLLITLLSAGTAFAQTNTAFGTGALASPGSINLSDSAFGYFALTSPTTGDLDTAVGVDALRNDNTGSDNTAIGFQALQENIAGHDNTAS